MTCIVPSTTDHVALGREGGSGTALVVAEAGATLPATTTIASAEATSSRRNVDREREDAKAPRPLNKRS
ncbi:MAG: hypothetical protein OXH28_12940 [bacterium]|nr:hypothetical protein [bacterium]